MAAVNSTLVGPPSPDPDLPLDLRRDDLMMHRGDGLHQEPRSRQPHLRGQRREARHQAQRRNRDRPETASRAASHCTWLQLASLAKSENRLTRRPPRACEVVAEGWHRVPPGHTLVWATPRMVADDTHTLPLLCGKPARWCDPARAGDALQPDGKIAAASGTREGATSRGSSATTRTGASIRASATVESPSTPLVLNPGVVCPRPTASLSGVTSSSTTSS